MAVPKKRTSVSRKGLRRAGQHHKLYANNQIITDPTTGELALKHRISPSGYYKGVKIFEVKAKETEEAETAE